MLEKMLQEYSGFRISLRIADDGQAFVVAANDNVQENPKILFTRMYDEIYKTLKDHNILIFHERIFASKKYYKNVESARKSIVDKYAFDLSTPFSYIDQNPYWGEGISGVHMHGVIAQNNEDTIENITYNGVVCGRLLDRQDSTLMMLHSIHGLDKQNSDAYTQTLAMYEKANQILLSHNFEYSNVVRTWVYLDKILEQYDNFNKARNLKYKEFGLIPGNVISRPVESINLPASTGIMGGNIFQSSGFMDVLAVKMKNKSNTIRNETGKKQKSAYRYGSAFSRAVTINTDKSKMIYLSGTASINDTGDTVYLNNINKQIEMTDSVINQLIGIEKLDWNNLCEGTVFLKKAEYILEFNNFLSKRGLTDLPFIVTVADVCRDDLLFEIDATFIS